MDSYLEAIPCDILQYIALLTTIDSRPPLGVPHGILALLCTSPMLYHSLCVRSCPHLYADIFRSRFDVCAISRRFKFQLTDSALARELVLRCRMLQRVRARSFLSSELRQDLWTAFWMAQESDGLNELQLRHVGLPEYLLDIVKSWDENDILCEAVAGHELGSLVIWLLCFTLTRQHILSLSSGVRVALTSLLLRYARNVHRPPCAVNGSFLLSHVLLRDQANGTNGIQAAIPQSTHRELITHHETKPIVIHGREWIPKCPDPTSAAIHLHFCLRELDPMVIPEHLPETRSIAIAIQRFGPTKEDVRKIRGYRTTLFADTAPWSQNRDSSVVTDVGRSRRHDVEFQKMVLTDGGATEVKPLSAMRGMMSGVWEGFYMIAGMVISAPGAIGHERQHPTIPDFLGRKPLQSVFTEFHCFGDGYPNFPGLEDTSDLRNLLKMGLGVEDGFEIDGRKYEKFKVNTDSREGCQPGREEREPADIVLLGETLGEHAQAWGGYRYAGRIRKDGSIILKRGPQEGDSEALPGTWIFEGRMRFGTVLVGTWWSSSSSANNISSVQGIFSMQKRANHSTSW